MLDREGLRPTPDRVRETLFNWLAPTLPGARVLDCFAGAGGLGLEAASRSAGSVTLVDKERPIAASLKQQCERFGSDNTTVIAQDVLSYLPKVQEGFDVVFIDPPYAAAELREQVLDLLIDLGLLNPSALIYLEWPLDQQMTLKHPNLSWLKQKKAGNLCYALAQWGVSR